ncbi:MAG: T9SS type A sorting domain-containing protein [Aequorivita sp.]
MKRLLLFIGILFFSISIQAQPIVNENPFPLLECDVNNNGFAYFDLHVADADISMGDTSLLFTYHINYPDAQTGINALISPYMNEVPYNQVVFARAEDSQSGLFAIVELELQVVQILPINQPIDLHQIDENGDGLAFFDLTENSAIMLEGLYFPAYFVSYYESEENAAMGVYAIMDPTAYQNLQNPQTIYVRVENMSGSCIALASFIISTEYLSVNSLGFENLNIFPNPASGNVTIQSSQLVSETTISLYDILGKKLLSEKILPQNAAISLDISSFKNGVYFVKIAYPTGKETVRKLVKE